MSDQQEYLKNIIIHTLTSDSLDDAIKNITAELGKLFNADRVHFRFYDQAMETFSEVIEEYRKHENIPSSKGKMIYPLEFDNFLKDKLVSKEHILIIDDINALEYPDLFKQLFKSLEINNEIVLPIFYLGKLESAFFITNTESSELLSEKNLRFIIPIANEISIGTHLFKVQNSLIKANSYEKILREIIIEVRAYENSKQVFEYLVNRLADLFEVNKVLHINSNSLGDFVVIHEALRDKVKDLEGKTIFTRNSFSEIVNFTEDSITIVNTVEQIKNTELKESLSKNDIKSFMLYPIEGFPDIKEKIMVRSGHPEENGLIKT